MGGKGSRHVRESLAKVLNGGVKILNAVVLVPLDCLDGVDGCADLLYLILHCDRHVCQSIDTAGKLSDLGVIDGVKVLEVSVDLAHFLRDHILVPAEVIGMRSEIRNKETARGIALLDWNFREIGRWEENGCWCFGWDA